MKQSSSSSSNNNNNNNNNNKNNNKSRTRNMGHAKDLYLTHVALYMTVEIDLLVKIDYHSYMCESICRTKVSF